MLSAETSRKRISFGHIEDFLFDQEGISEKTRFNIRSVLHDFFGWVSKREQIPMPDFPDVSFELGWRNIIDIRTQQEIIGEIKAISHGINPKIWLGIKWLSTYISVRPGELIAVQERQINISMGSLVIPHPKEKTPKIVYLLGEDVELLKSIPRGFPDLYFFRHPKGIKGV